MRAEDRDRKIADAKLNRPHRRYAQYDEATGKTKEIVVRNTGDGELRRFVEGGDYIAQQLRKEQ